MTPESITSPAGSSPSGAVEKAFACMSCRDRKVKCNRQDPCSNCVKGSTECVFVAPIRGKRKRREASLKEGLHAKLRRYEEILGVEGREIIGSSNSIKSTRRETEIRPAISVASPFGESLNGRANENRAKIVQQKGGSSRYFDNGLWLDIGKEFEHPAEQSVDDEPQNANGVGQAPAPEPYTEANFAYGLIIPPVPGVGLPRSLDLSRLHPPVHVMKGLWEIFLERLDPLYKILHGPTFWTSLTDVTQNPNGVSKSATALIFAFYASTVNALDDSECQNLMGEEKSIVLTRYRCASHQAMLNAEFIKTTNVVTLQAFMFFLLGMKGIWQNDSMFILSGIAVRMARRMGLHRDGSSLGLCPFDTEMRRRLWWQIVVVDTRISDFSGTKPSLDLRSDCKAPLNVLDDDLDPTMTQFPPERHGITPVVLTLLRCDTMDFFQKIDSCSSQETDGDNHDRVVARKDRLITEMEDLLERKYIRYCDPVDPLHVLVSVVTRSAICRVKLLAHNPRQFADRGIKLPQRERDIVYTNAIKLLEYGNMLHSNPSTKVFANQVGASFLWDTLLYVLIETRHRKTGPTVDRTWELIGTAVLWYPRIFQKETETVFLALGSWTLQVWDDCVAARKAEGLPDQLEPAYIAKIRMARRPKVTNVRSGIGDTAVVNDASAPNGTDGGQMNDFDEFQSYDFSNMLSFDLGQDEWAQWERLIGQGS